MQDPVTALATMQEQFATFRGKWRAWVATQPATKRCEIHCHDRPCNEAVSVSRSWQRQEMVMVWKRCRFCVRDEIKAKGK